MSEAKPRLVWVAEHDDDSDYLSVMERLDTQGVYEGVTVCRLHDEAAADLIADAGTVFHTTGLTPSQLVERVKELEEAAKLVLDWYEAENDHSKTDFYQRVQMCRDSEDALRAAISKARPNTAEGG